MSIRISNTSIHFGNFTLTANTEGFSFDGKIRAKRGFVDSSPPNAMGTAFGYHSHGSFGGLPAPIGAIPIEKFPFALETTVTEVGDVFQERNSTEGTSSDISGYVHGGSSVPGAYVDTIEKYPFATDTNGSDVGNLTVATTISRGTESSTSGYSLGGRISPGSRSTTTNIEKYSFAVDGNATDIGDTTNTREGVAGNSSSVNGYLAGGGTVDPFVAQNTIDKFPFATDTNASDVGDLATATRNTCGASSKENGYILGGTGGGSAIQKFPFATDTNATNVGDLSADVYQHASTSSTTEGYRLSGNSPLPTPPFSSGTVEKFPFAVDSNSTVLGDLLSSSETGAGNQN